MKNSLTIVLSAVLAFVMIAFLAGMQNSSQDDLQAIRTQLADLGLRVSRLEQASGVKAGPTNSSDSSHKTIARSMVVAGMNTFANSDANKDEIDKLTKDSESLQKTAQYHLDEQERTGGVSYNLHGRYSDNSSGYVHTNGSVEDQINQRQMANRYATEASIKRQKAQALTDAANEPHQIINGHDGNITFTLRTKHNLADELSKINIGDTVTWVGTRVSGDDTSETWEITSIHKVEAN